MYTGTSLCVWVCACISGWKCYFTLTWNYILTSNDLWPLTNGHVIFVTREDTLKCSLICKFGMNRTSGSDVSTDCSSDRRRRTTEGMRHSNIPLWLKSQGDKKSMVTLSCDLNLRGQRSKYFKLHYFAEFILHPPPTALLLWSFFFFFYQLPNYKY